MFVNAIIVISTDKIVIEICALPTYKYGLVHTNVTCMSIIIRHGISTGIERDTKPVSVQVYLPI